MNRSDWITKLSKMTSIKHWYFSLIKEVWLSSKVSIIIFLSITAAVIMVSCLISVYLAVFQLTVLKRAPSAVMGHFWPVNAAFFICMCFLDLHRTFWLGESSFCSHHFFLFAVHLEVCIYFLALRHVSVWSAIRRLHVFSFFAQFLFAAHLNVCMYGKYKVG